LIFTAAPLEDELLEAAGAVALPDPPQPASKAATATSELTR
jgi:hypothetical protein